MPTFYKMTCVVSTEQMQTIVEALEGSASQFHFEIIPSGNDIDAISGRVISGQRYVNKSEKTAAVTLIIDIMLPWPNKEWNCRELIRGMRKFGFADGTVKQIIHRAAEMNLIVRTDPGYVQLNPFTGSMSPETINRAMYARPRA